MNPWFAPTNYTEWRRRLLSPRAMVLAACLAALAATEMRFDWMEKAIGAYLVTTNAYRPQSGKIWEQGQLADSARDALAQVAHQRQSIQHEARRARSLGQVIAGLEEKKGAMISAEHFLGLYLKLPPLLSNEIVSPFTLLTFTNAARWQRTFLEKENSHLRIYLLDTRNQVIHRLDIGPDLIGHIERGEVAVGTRLDQLSDFAAHIYAADHFFASLANLPEEVRRNIVSHPEDLLRMSARIRRVGISDGEFGNTVDLGFEVDGPEGDKVILMQGDRHDVRRLQRELEAGRPPGRRHGEAAP